MHKNAGCTKNYVKLTIIDVLTYYLKKMSEGSINIPVSKSFKNSNFLEIISRFRVTE